MTHAYRARTTEGMHARTADLSNALTCTSISLAHSKSGIILEFWDA